MVLDGLFIFIFIFCVISAHDDKCAPLFYDSWSVPLATARAVGEWWQKACSFVLDEMYNKSSSARESLVDFATRTLDRKSTLWVIGSGATGIKCRRQWKTNILAKLQSKKDCSFLWQWRRCISYGAYKIACAVPYLLAIESILVPAVIVAILAQVLCVFVASWR